MAWSDLTITRDDIDAFEGATFTRYNDVSTLRIADNDHLVLSVSKQELEDDIIRTMDDFDFTETELLDELESVDERGLLTRMLTYKFLANWFFQDSAKEDSLAYAKAREYMGKYYRALNGGLSSLASKLSTPKNPPRFQMRRA